MGRQEGDLDFCPRGGGEELCAPGGRKGGQNSQSHYKEPTKDVFVSKKFSFFLKKNDILKSYFCRFLPRSWKKILGVRKEINKVSCMRGDSDFPFRRG